MGRILLGGDPLNGSYDQAHSGLMKIDVMLLSCMQPSRVFLALSGDTGAWPWHPVARRTRMCSSAVASRLQSAQAVRMRGCQ